LTTKNVYSQARKHKNSFAVTLAPQETLVPQETMWRKQLKLGFGVIPDLNIREILRVQVFGNTFLSYFKPAGYSSAVPVYLVKCSRHGLYLDTPHGNAKYFQCHDCLVEAKAEVEKRTKLQ
jgi:hypothetical protein